VKEGCQKVAGELKAEKDVVSEDVQQIKANSSDGWQEMKHAVGKAIDDLSGAIDKALSKFKQ